MSDADDDDKHKKSKRMMKKRKHDSSTTTTTSNTNHTKKTKKSWQVQLEKMLNEILKPNDEIDDNNQFPSNLSSSNAVSVAVSDVHYQTLTNEQKSIYDLCTTPTKRINACIMGCAGSGKTYLERLIVQQLRYRYHPCSVAVLVPTGMASGGVEGSEIVQGFLGLSSKLLPPLNKDVKRAYFYLKKRKPILLHRMKLIQVVVFDEISMLHSELFDFIAEFFCYLHHGDTDTKSFGPVQVLCFGDPYQLPPVVQAVKGQSSEEQEHRLSNSFFFKAVHFYDTFEIQHLYELSVSIRQKEDTSFFQLLNRLKRGEMTEDDYKLLETCCVNQPTQIDDNHKNEWLPHVFCTNRQVEDCNTAQIQQVLANLDPKHATLEPKNGQAQPVIPWKKKYLDYYELRRSQYKKCKQWLKKVQHNDEGDGERSISLKSYMTSANKVIKEFIRDFGHMEKSRETAAIEIMRQFSKKVEQPVAYLYPGVRVVLTKNINVSQGLYHGKMGTIKDYCPSTQHPLIRWDDDDKKSPLPPLYRIDRFTWTVSFSEGQLSYNHYPLVYAWATTAHKFQGKTAEHGMITDLSQVFTWGQAYSLVSRVKRIADLRLLGLLKANVKFCHPEVLKFVDELHRGKQKLTTITTTKGSTSSSSSSGLLSLLQKQRQLAKQLIKLLSS